MSDSHVLRLIPTCDRFLTTGAERVAGVAGQTGADGDVIDYTALCVDATHAGTRVAAVTHETGEVGGAVGTDDTLRATPARVRVADVGRDTRAVRRDSVQAGALRVLSTRRGRAGVRGSRQSYNTSVTWSSRICM